MNRTLAIVVASAATVLVAGCSSAAPPAARPAAPGQSIRLAADRLSGGPYRMTATSTLSVAGSSTPSPLGSGLAAAVAHAATQTLQEQYADARHLAATITTADGSLHLVVYDGVAYVSTNGRTYKSAPSVTTLLDQLSASQVQGYAAHLTGTTDGGPSTQDGVATERYDSTVDPTYLSSLLSGVVSSIFGTVTTAKIPDRAVSDLVAAMHFQDVKLTWYVDRSTGHLVRELTTGSISVDLGTVMAAIGEMGIPVRTVPEGTVSLHETYDAHFSGWGQAIVVPKPTVTGSLTPEQLGELLADRSSG